MAPALVLEGAAYRYEETPRDALTGVSLRVEPGELVGVVGPTNAGKSTLCLVAMGLCPHFFGGSLRGRVEVFGRDSRSMSVIERSGDVGLLFQNPFTQLSGARERVDAEVAFGPECHGLPWAEIEERVAEAMALVGLEGLEDRHPLDLSGGQLQRLALAGLLAMRPRLLLLDEPTSQLDPAGTEAILSVVAGLTARGIAVVLVEHRLELVAEMCPRVVAMIDGHVVADGPPGDVFNDRTVAAGCGTPIYTRVASKLGLPAPLPVSLSETVAAVRARG